MSMKNLTFASIVDDADAKVRFFLHFPSFKKHKDL